MVFLNFASVFTSWKKLVAHGKADLVIHRKGQKNVVFAPKMSRNITSEMVKELFRFYSSEQAKIHRCHSRRFLTTILITGKYENVLLRSKAPAKDRTNLSQLAWILKWDWISISRKISTKWKIYFSEIFYNGLLLCMNRYVPRSRKFSILSNCQKITGSRLAVPEIFWYIF